jgi:hypothetical protein
MSRTRLVIRNQGRPRPRERRGREGTAAAEFGDVCNGTGSRGGEHADALRVAPAKPLGLHLVDWTLGQREDLSADIERKER